jgi:hypothetical protein
LPEIPSGEKLGLMPDPTPAASPPPQPSRWTEDAIFTVMSNHGRRRIIKSLANGVGRAASDLMGLTGKRLDATIKDCGILTKAGFLQMAPDPVDGRRMLYTLSPSVPVAQTAAGWELDFGCCVVRV